MVGRQLRNLLKDITMGNLTPDQINAVGKNVYADFMAKRDLDGLQDIVGAFRSVTVPTYGQFVPQSGAITGVTTDGTATLIEATGNEVIEVMAIDCVNGTLGALTCQLTLTDGVNTIQLTAAETVGPGARKIFSLTNPIYIDSNVKLQATNSGEMTVQVYSSKVAI